MTVTPTTSTIDPLTVLNRFEGFSATVLSVLGERLGLFRALAQSPSTSAALAGRLSLDGRYVREWLAAMTAAGYTTVDGTGSYALSEGADLLFASDDSPMPLGGVFEVIGSLLRVIDEVEFAFRHGGGVHQDRYGPDCSHGIARMNAPNYDNLLVPVWVPNAGLDGRLQGGAQVAEVGCGQGRALLRLAAAYPAGRYFGYDVFPEAVDAARSAATDHALPVSFEVRDASRGIPERCDVILAFDVIHDAADPEGLLRAMRGALAADGVALITEPEFESEGYPLAVTNYMFSLLYCMTTSLARGGAGLGTCGLPTERFEALAREAGFTSAERVESGTPVQRLFVLRP